MRCALFVTCLVDSLFPEVGVSTARLLHHLGAEIDFPEEQICCGQPAYTAGFAAEARKVAKSLIRALEGYPYVVSPSGSCTAMIHHGTRDLFRDDPVWSERARDLASRSYELSQFIVGVLGVRDVGARFPARVAYHPACHGKRILGLGDEPVELLKNVRGLDLRDLPDARDCCGFGGMFSLKMGHLSSAMVQTKVRHIRETEAQVLVSTDMGCLMNIGGRIRREGGGIRVMHLAQLLDEGLRDRPVPVEPRT